jgi:hypothetical protein
MVKGTRVLMGEDALKYTNAVDALRRLLHQ